MRPWAGPPQLLQSVGEGCQGVLAALDLDCRFRQLEYVQAVGPLSVPRPYTRKPGWNPAGAMPLSSIVPPPESSSRTSASAEVPSVKVWA